MSGAGFHLVIDARPRSARGLLAAEVLLGKSMLDHLLEIASELAPSAEPVVVHAREDERSRLTELASRFMARGVQFVYGPPRADAVVLRTDRFYDLGRSSASCVGAGRRNRPSSGGSTAPKCSHSLKKS